MASDHASAIKGYSDCERLQTKDRILSRPMLSIGLIALFLEGRRIEREVRVFRGRQRILHGAELDKHLGY